MKTAHTIEDSPDRPGETYADKPKGYYDALNMNVVWRVKGQNLHVLDVGCASGRLIEYLREQGQIAKGYGIEGFPEAAEQARNHLDAIWVGDVETLVPDLAPATLDYIIYGDILEHLRNPKQVLINHLPLLKPGGAIVISTPNVAYFGVIASLFFRNDWKYEPYGLMDATHLRWFTTKSMARMLRELGLSMTNLVFGYRSSFRRRLCKIFPFLGRFLGEQMIFVARITSKV